MYYVVPRYVEILPPLLRTPQSEFLVRDVVTLLLYFSHVVVLQGSCYQSSVFTIAAWHRPVRLHCPLRRLIPCHP